MSGCSDAVLFIHYVPRFFLKYISIYKTFLPGLCSFLILVQALHSQAAYVNTHVIAVGMEITAGCVEQATCCESFTDELVAKDTHELLW